MNNYQEDIAKTWDNIHECLADKTKAISREDFMRAKAGELEISLAGIKTVPKEWFPNLKGKNILTGSMVNGAITLKPWECAWVKESGK